MAFRLLLLFCVPLVLVAEEPELHLSAYYYPWYSHDRHWHEGFLKEEGDPALGEYNSRSPSVIRQHLEWSRRAGIDNWICSWWGPGSWEDDTLRRYAIPVLDRENNPANPTICIFYETEGLLGLDPERGIVFDKERIDEFVEHFRFLAENYFGLPSYYRVDGKPVVYLYLSRTFAGDYAQAIARARAATRALGYEIFLVGDEIYWGEPDEKRIALWDAVTAYNLHGPPKFGNRPDETLFVSECDELYGRWSDVCTRLGVAHIPGFIPGFNNHGADPEKRHYPISRQLHPGASETSTLESLAGIAISHANPKINAVALTSFNEWHEDSQVEPREKNGEPDEKHLDRLRVIFGKN